MKYQPLCILDLDEVMNNSKMDHKTAGVHDEKVPAPEPIEQSSSSPNIAYYADFESKMRNGERIIPGSFCVALTIG